MDASIKAKIIEKILKDDKNATHRDDVFPVEDIAGRFVLHRESLFIEKFGAKYVEDSWEKAKRVFLES